MLIRANQPDSSKHIHFIRTLKGKRTRMDKALNLQKSLIIFSVPLLIIGIMVLIANSPVFNANPIELSIGITSDLLVTMPVVYFLLIRKTNIPKTTVVLLLIIGVITCSLILPQKNQYYLDLFKVWTLPAVELSILSFLAYKVGKGIKRYKLNIPESSDFFTALKNTCYEILPKGVVIPVVTEIAVIYYGFIHWKKRASKSNEFTYHKTSGTVTLLIAILFVVAAETLVLHILLSMWSKAVAWALTVLSFYSGIQIFGFLKSILKRPIIIDNGKLYLRHGIMAETVVDLQDIDAIEISSKNIELNNETRTLSILGELESHNIIIRLKTKNILVQLYGIKRPYKNLVLYVDDKIEFKNQLDNALQQLQ